MVYLDKNNTAFANVDEYQRLVTDELKARYLLCPAGFRLELNYPERPFTYQLTNLEKVGLVLQFIGLKGEGILGSVQLSSAPCELAWLGCCESSSIMYSDGLLWQDF